MRSQLRTVIGLALGLSLATCEKDGKTTRRPDCDSDIKYDARKVEGRVDVAKFGVTASTSVEAVRQVDQAVERYMSRWKTMCMDYKNGALTQEQYGDEAKGLRERMEKLEQGLMALELAPDAHSYETALRQIFMTMVEPEKVIDLQLDLGIMVQRPGETQYSAAAPGASIPTGANVYFTVQTSAIAHIYLYQETASGKVNVMFPHPQMPMANPLPAGQSLRIPPTPGFFTLDPEGVGSEQVHIVASTEPLARLETSLTRTQPTAEELACGARDLNYNPGTACDTQARTFGLTDPGEAPGVSMRVANTAGAKSIHQIFTFEHTP